jgi:VanZ family protein
MSARPASAWHRVGPVEAKRIPIPQAWIAVVAHLVVYGTLGAMLERGLPVGRARFRWTAAWIVATGYGVSDELHQSTVDGRDASVFDVATDAVGAAAGIAASQLVRTRICGMPGAVRRETRRNAPDNVSVRQRLTSTLDQG